MSVPNNNPQLNGYPGTQSPQGATPYQGRAQQSATAGQPAVPGVSAQPVQPVPQWAPGVPVQPAPQGYSTAPQGFAPGYAPVPQGPVVQKVNRLSIILGIVGWVLVGLTVLGTYLAIRAIPSDADPSGADIVGFIPFLGLPFIGSVNLAGGVIGIVGAVGKPKTQKLNWLGILLNASPYIVFIGLMTVPMFVK